MRHIAESFDPTEALCGADILGDDPNAPLCPECTGRRDSKVPESGNGNLLQRALAHPYTRASFATLSKHSASGAFDPIAALRLLRRNIRDVEPGATWIEQQRGAIALLQHWRNASNATNGASRAATE